MDSSLEIYILMKSMDFPQIQAWKSVHFINQKYMSFRHVINYGPSNEKPVEFSTIPWAANVKMLLT